MDVKLLELRDSMTFIPVMAISLSARSEADVFLLRRAGFSLETALGSDGHRVVQLVSFNNNRSCSDPYEWGGRTYPVAHQYIVDHWDELTSGSVVDVEFILGETTAPKGSERGTL